MLPGDNILQAQTDEHVAVPSYSLLDHAEEGGHMAVPSYSLLDHAEEGGHVAVPSYSLLDHADEGGRVKLIGTPFQQVHSSAAVFVSFCLLAFCWVLFLFCSSP